MPAFMQDRHDPDVAVRRSAPMDEVPFMAEEISRDSEFGRELSRHYPETPGPVESVEQAGDIAICLFLSPAIARVAVDFVETMGSNERAYR